MLRLIVCGIFGRMGTALQDLVRESEDVSIVAGVYNKARDNISSYEKVKKNPDFPTFPTIMEVESKADCVISFLPPTALDESMALLEYCTGKKLPAVICTTGLSRDFTIEMNKASKETAILYAANLSFGVNLVTEMLDWFSEKLLKEGFDAEIIEAHHGKKIDAPSGTALQFADTINNRMLGEMNYVYDRSKKHEKRTKDEIGIHSVRGGGINGDHKIIFAGEHEVMEISLRVLSRKAFVKGAMRAASFLQLKPPGMYNVKDLIYRG